jgi:uncharacterized membrane protein
MDRISKMNAEIDVDAPIRAVYDQWTQFESFPQFLHAVKDVKQVGDTMTHWVVSVGGVKREFDAEITEQIPDQVVAWTSLDGKSHSGSVRFRPDGDGQTHVTLDMMWLPETFTEKVGAALNIDERQAQLDLARFKDLMEERGGPTGAWRGEVHQGVTEGDRSSDSGGTAADELGYGSGTWSDGGDSEMPPEPDRT